MDDVVYKTDSDEHLVNIGEKSESQLDLLTEQDLNDYLYDSWDIDY